MSEIIIPTIVKTKVQQISYSLSVSIKDQGHKKLKLKKEQAPKFKNGTRLWEEHKMMGKNIHHTSSVLEPNMNHEHLRIIPMMMV
jgi:hypothetical protein